MSAPAAVLLAGLLALPWQDAATATTGTAVSGSAAGQPATVYVVRLRGDSVAAAHGKTAPGASLVHAQRQEIAAGREQALLAMAGKLGRRPEVVQVYDVLLNAVALRMDPQEAASIAGLASVVSVEADFRRQLLTDASPRWLRADRVWSSAAGVTTRGEGVVVGIVDSGINPGSPSLTAVSPLDGYVHTNPRGQFYGRCLATPTACNNKLIGIWDFTSGAGSNEPDDGETMLDHGREVAALAVGNPVQMTFATQAGPQTATGSGVAPRANLISYKACEGRVCRGTWLLAALQQALLDGVDVLNYSLGTPAGDPWTLAEAQALLELRHAGIVVTVAAGDTPYSGSVKSPANAPWVLAVGNGSHDRLVSASLVALTGGATAPPPELTLRGAGSLGYPLGTGGVANGPIAFDPAHPTCAAGSDLANPASPWPPGRWAGTLLVCRRSAVEQAKLRNIVIQSQAAGLVLVNASPGQEKLRVDSEGTPATLRLGYNAGQALTAWLGSGTGHRATLAATQLRQLPQQGDLLGDQSAYGPVYPSGVLKPDLLAPGHQLLNPLSAYPGGEFQILNGSSYASANAAGAAALVLAARPQWTPSQVMSALVTTARAGIVRGDGLSPAASFERGNGMIDVEQAVRAPLFFDATRAQFLAADPAKNGKPRDLNLPALVHDECAASCTLSRRVTDMAGGGRWNLSASAGAGLTITPRQSTLELAAGASAPLDFDFVVSDSAAPDSWLYGEIVIASALNDNRPNLILPVAIFRSSGPLPELIDRSIDSDAGHFDVVFPALGNLAGVRWSGSALVRPTVTNLVLPQTTRPYDVQSIDSGSATTYIKLQPSADGSPLTYRLIVELDASSSVESVVYVGRTSDVREANLLCTSRLPGNRQRCEVEVLHPGGTTPQLTYWAMMQNISAGASGSDRMVLRLAAVPVKADNNRLAITGPGVVPPAEAVPLRVTWNDPSLVPGEYRYGLAMVSRGAAAPHLVVPVQLRYTGNQPAARRLRERDAGQLVRLAPGTRRERIYFDVPPGVNQFNLWARSNFEPGFSDESPSGSLRQTLYRVAAPTGPGIAPAPTTGAVASIDGSVLNLTGSQVLPGRWYVLLENTSATRTISFNLQYTGTFDTSSGPEPTRIDLRSGHYYNPARSGHGVFLDYSNDQWFIVWYTYLQDGSPTWYFAQGPASTGSFAFWDADLFRVTWDGTASRATVVGRAGIVATGTSALNFHYSLDGESGSEPMQRLGGGGCPTVASLPLDGSGHWYAPSRPGFGYSLQFEPGTEVLAAYLYDGLGFPRWLIGQKSFDAAQGDFVLQQLAGFCPLCAHSALTSQNVGIGTRRLGGSDVREIGIDAQFQAPLQGIWQQDLPVSLLSARKACR